MTPTNYLFFCGACIVFLGDSARAAAQALDVGGISIHLGQRAGEVLPALSPYVVRYDAAGQFWLVMQKPRDRYERLGSFSARDGRIISVAKQYPVGDPHDLPRAYTAALRDARRLGGASCTTKAVEWTDDLVHEVETRCGAYRLTLTLPQRVGEDELDPGVRLFLGEAPRPGIKRDGG